jgi:ABC-type uncharacterized transport system substrate-binding protein
MYPTPSCAEVGQSRVTRWKGSWGQNTAYILKGTKPGELPVELPTKYDLVFNLATAKVLKLDIPAKLLALADEAIE